MNPHSLALLCIPVLIAPAALAQNTVQDFEALFSDDPSPVNTRFDQNGTDPPASWFDGDADGWAGGYVQLTAAAGNQNNAISINDSTGAGWDALVIDFEFRGSDPGSTGGADGFGLVLFPTSLGADTLTPPPNWQPEEPNVAGAFGLGLDTWGNNAVGETDEFVGDGAGAASNHTSLHWNGTSLTQDTTIGSVIPEFLLGNGPTDFIRGQLILDAQAKTATLTLDAANDGIGTGVLTQYSTVALPADFAAYDGRVALRGRTGGSNELIQFDNIVVTRFDGGVETEVINEDFSTPPAAAVFMPATPTGGTPYTVEQIGSEPPLILTEATLEATVTGGNTEPGLMRLVEETGDQINNIAFDQTSTKTGVIRGSFDFGGRSQEGSRADGLGFALVDVGAYGTTGGVGNFNSSEDPGFANAFAIGIDSHPGGGNDNGNNNHLSVHWNGAFLDRVETSDFDIVSTDLHTLDFTLTQAGGGYELDVVVTDGSDGSVTTIWDGYSIPGMAFGPGGARVAFAGRTGGAFDEYFIDNVDIAFLDLTTFEITNIVYDRGNDEFTISWTADETTVYGLYWSLTMADGDWVEDVSDSISAGGGDPLASFADGVMTYGPFPNPTPGAPEIFFRSQNLGQVP